MRRILFFILLFACNFASAQQKLAYELDLSIDNDAFYLVAAEDEYYSSGIYATFRKSLNPESTLYQKFNKKDRVVNIIQGFHFSHLIFTADDISYDNVNMLDRPYAGGFAFGYSMNLFRTNNWYFSIQQDVGLMGPATGTGRLQRWWHNILNMPEPKGWGYQINNTPYINTTLEAAKSLKLGKAIDLVYESKLALGTIFNNIRQGFLLRVGSISSLGSSGYKNGLLGLEYDAKTRHKTVEWYFFLGVSTEYVIYNATIEGNLIGEAAIYTEKARRFLLLRKSGLNVHWQKLDLGLHFYYNTAETFKSHDHRYIRLKIARRF